MTESTEFRRINCIFVPIPHEDGNYLKIQFPIVKKTIAELAEIKNPEIVAKIGTIHDVIRDIDASIPFQVIETYAVKSFEIAIDHYGIITQRE